MSEHQRQSLAGKTALITGGNSGIGLASAKRLAADGAKVIIIGRDQDSLDKAVHEIGDKASSHKADVSDLGQLKSLFDKLASHGTKLDIVFANAGVAKFGSISDADEHHYDHMFNINVKGLFFTVKYALPLLNDGGSVILNASIAGSLGFEDFSVYSATKAAVRSFARTWAKELAPQKTRVNAISPGPIETPIYSRMDMSEEEMQSVGESFASQVPLQRFGSSDEVAGAVAFLASSDSSYITGIELAVDGGFAQV